MFLFRWRLKRLSSYLVFTKASVPFSVPSLQCPPNTAGHVLSITISALNLSNNPTLPHGSTAWQHLHSCSTMGPFLLGSTGFTFHPRLHSLLSCPAGQPLSSHPLPLLLTWAPALLSWKREIVHCQVLSPSYSRTAKLKDYIFPPLLDRLIPSSVWFQSFVLTHLLL